MAKRKKNIFVRVIITVVIAALLAALGYRAVTRWKPSVFKRSQRMTPRQSAERFRRMVLARSDSGFAVAPRAADSIPRLAVVDYSARPFVLTNLALQRQARACGIELLSAFEDRKLQGLELVYGAAQRPLLAISIRRKLLPPEASSPARPRIALVVYQASGADKAFRAALAQRPEIKTMVTDKASSASGRELLVPLPLEPIGYPKEDPGPGTILLDDSDSKIAAKLAKRRATVSRPVGFAAEAGSRALKDKRIAFLVTRFCADNGLIFLEPRFTANSLAKEQSAANGCPYLTAAVYIEKTASVKSAAAQIRNAFQHARKNRSALLMLPARADVLKALGKALTKEALAEFEFVGVSKLGK